MEAYPLGKPYWFRNDLGRLVWKQWEGNLLDEDRRDSGNFFRSENEGQRVAEAAETA